MNLQTPPRRHGGHQHGPGGFTLIEVMVTVAIIAILASIAFPSYTDYLRRGQVQEAPRTLADVRVQLEQYYQDNRSYGSATACGVTLPAGTHFNYTCTTTGQAYSIKAVGNGGLVAGLTYTIDERNAQASVCAGCAWGFGTVQSWVLRRP